MGSAVGRMISPQQPYMQDFYNAVNQQGFNQQLGRGVSNQMYQPPRSDYDVYTATRRPNYMPYGPNQQFYQPIYQPSYSQFSPMGYGQAPFGGFYQQPQQNMFGPATDISAQGQAALRQMPQPMLSPQPMQQQYAPAQMQQTQPSSSGDAFADLVVPMLRRSSFGSRRPAPSNFQYSVNYDSPMLSPQPMQTQYRPIPYMTQTQIDAKAAADAAAAAPVNMGFSGDGAKAGGKVHGEGIDSLLKK